MGLTCLNLAFATLSLALAWTLVILTALLWNTSKVRQEMLETAYLQAEVAYGKDVVYRRWNTNHGGVYVPATEKSPPNPYLNTIAGQELTTTAGDNLTLMNPAYMSRQVYELEKEISDVRSHLTSLKPIKPENSPDPWEKKALEAFERGDQVTTGLDTLEGREYFRFMRPFITEKGCLKCHAQQGYREGDIRGGISVSIPMVPLKIVTASATERLILIHLLLWVLGLTGLGIGYWNLRSSEKKREKAEKELETALGTVEEQVRTRTLELHTEIEERMRAETMIRRQLDELKTWQRMIVGREERNLELKHEVNDLLKQLGKQAKYE